ncbi:MAG: hypothetical protein JWM98_747 [Thermoleophilia bacterium]|nr:hypothetical protein [Thermoleophilia bacterium]
MSISPSAPTATLPPWITPTLPSAPEGYTTSPSGLLLPSLTVPSAGGLVTAKAEDLDHVPSLVQARRDELAASIGAPAADAMLGAAIQVADAAATQIEHDRIVAAFMSGDLAAALAAAGSAH